uniref:Uncharacterized protein n=1 Tax=Acrobeloides nanus TaxID=290746 RepID=A0A914E951_9BILA
MAPGPDSMCPRHVGVTRPNWPSSKLPTPQPTIFRPKRATTYPPSLSSPLKSPPHELGDEVDMKEKTEKLGNNCVHLHANSVELWEEDGYLGDNNDLLGWVVTNQGNFSISGEDNEFGYADFFLKTYTTCGLTEQQLEEKCKRISIHKIHRGFNNRIIDDFKWILDDNFDGDTVQC